MKIRNLLLLLALASLWGPSFLLIKIAVAEIPPMMLAAFRISIAALVFWGFLWLKGESPVKDLKFWKHAAIAGLFAHAIPFTLINWGEMYIDSALASILNGLTPIFTIVLANFMIRDEKMTVSKLIGTLTGFAGLIVLVSPNLRNGMNTSFWGIAAVSAGAVSYGVAIIYSRLFLMKAPVLHAPASQLLVTAVYLLPLSFILEPKIDVGEISAGAITAVLVLGVFGTAFAFVLYYRILARAGAAYLSLVTYLMPVYGVILGVIFLNESLGKETIWGAVVILTGLLIANRRQRTLMVKPKMKQVCT